MPKPVKPSIIRARDYAAQRFEARGQPTHMDFEADDGTVVRLPHPLCLDDAALARYEAFRAGDGLDREALLEPDGTPRVDTETGQPATRIITPHRIGGALAEPVAVRTMRAVLGDAGYEKLNASGLHALLLNDAWERMLDTAEIDE